MGDLDRQLEYWDKEGPQKTFGHPINFDWLAQWLNVDCRILDLKTTERERSDRFQFTLRVAFIESGRFAPVL